MVFLSICGVRYWSWRQTSLQLRRQIWLIILLCHGTWCLRAKESKLSCYGICAMFQSYIVHSSFCYLREILLIRYTWKLSLEGWLGWSSTWQSLAMLAQHSWVMNLLALFHQGTLVALLGIPLSPYLPPSLWLNAHTHIDKDWIHNLFYNRMSFSLWKGEKMMIFWPFLAWCTRSIKALKQEREYLAKRVSSKLTEEEREMLYIKWEIPAVGKQRRLQLVNKLWTDPHNMEHIKESAEIVAKLVGFCESGEHVSKEMFELNFVSHSDRKPWMGWNLISNLLHLWQIISSCNSLIQFICVLIFITLLFFCKTNVHPSLCSKPGIICRN